MKLKTIMLERIAWQEHNFPDETDVDCFLGMVEEAGELAHHYLKRKQGIRGKAEYHREQIIDALGDFTIYMMGPMYRAEIDPDEMYVEGLTAGKPHPNSQILNTQAQTIGKLAKDAGLCAAISSLGRWRVPIIFLTLDRIARMEQVSFPVLVEMTWKEVKQRDWQKNQETGEVK